MNLFETNRRWIAFTGVIAFLAVIVHICGQTAGFTDSYWGDANLYNVPGIIGFVMSLCGHSGSSMGVTSIILNFNLPSSFKNKWIIGLVVALALGLLWEGGELIAFIFKLVNWLLIENLDTFADLIIDFFSASFIVLLYSKIVPQPEYLSIDELMERTTR